MCYRNKLVLKKNQSGLTILGLTIAYSFISLFYLLMTLLCSFSGITNDNSQNTCLLFVVFIVCIGSVQARMKMFGKY